MSPAADEQLSIPLKSNEGVMAPWAVAFQAHQLEPLPICVDLSAKLGLAKLGVEVRQDSRGRGRGLFTTQPIYANTVVCVMSGLMMAQEPDGEEFIGSGYLSLPPTMKQQLQERVAGSRAPPDTGEQTCWSFLAESFRMAFPGHEGGRKGCPGRHPLELQMLGHGGWAAYINDPRVDDRWGAAAGGQGQQQQQLGNAADVANCLVVPVMVRGVPLPVLVALRDIAPGEQLLREYGDDWWSRQKGWLSTLKMYNINPDVVLHGPAAAAAGAAIP
ncbi:hypothetical protein PLESTM_000083700 [Pleodorina starrii]|nr:hypothetical protein PLESTM_000083700 [Pleodorina starrii]